MLFNYHIKVDAQTLNYKWPFYVLANELIDREQAAVISLDV